MQSFNCLFWCANADGHHCRRVLATRNTELLSHALPVPSSQSINQGAVKSRPCGWCVFQVCERIQALQQLFKGPCLCEDDVPKPLPSTAHGLLHIRRQGDFAMPRDPILFHLHEKRIGAIAQAMRSAERMREQQAIWANLDAKRHALKERSPNAKVRASRFAIVPYFTK